MHRRLFLALVALPTFACAHSTAPATSMATPARGKEPLVEFEMMTWPEVKAAMESGKTTALFYTGGTEQRGPQNVNGGHTLMARATVKAATARLASGSSPSSQTERQLSSVRRSSKQSAGASPAGSQLP